MWYVCPTLILFSLVISTQAEETSQPVVATYPPCKEVCEYREVDSRSLGLLQCNITSPTEDGECGININEILPRQPKRQNGKIDHYLTLRCQHPVLIHIVDNVGDSIQSSNAKTYSHVHNCDIFWGDLALIGTYTDLRGIFHQDALDKFQEEIQDPNSIFNQSPGQSLYTTQDLPYGLRNVRTYRFSANLRSRLEHFPPVFTRYRWPSLVKAAFENVSFDQISGVQEETMPSLQAIDIVLASFTAVPFSFSLANCQLPWYTSTANFDDQLHSPKYCIEPSNYHSWLCLKYCNISTLPDMAFHGMIHSVTVSHCGVISVSVSAFQRLVAVQHIDLSHNEISVLPGKVFQGLDQLSNLDLAYNRIEYLELEFFWHLPHLRILSLKGNSLSSIESEAFLHMSQLNSLDLSSNQLIFVADDFVDTDGDKIVKINLSQNHLHTIPSACTYLRGLQDLDLSHNDLNFESVKALLTATKLSQLENRHHVHPAYVQSAIKKLDMSHNNITTFRIQDLNEEQIEVLWLLMFNFRIMLTSNPLHCDCYIFPLHQFFIERDCADFRECKFYMDNLLCHSPKHLAHRPIGAVKDTEFRCLVELADCPEPCTCYNTSIGHLIEVDCSNQNLNQLPNSLPDGTKHLILRNTNLTSLQVVPDYLSDLSILDMSHNSISEISPDFIGAISVIYAVQLDYNRLSSIPKSFQSIHLQSEKLHLGFNPIKCDCLSAWMRDYLMAHRSVIPDIDNIVCASGVAQGEILVEVPFNSICEPMFTTTYQNITISLAVIMAAFLTVTCIAYHFRGEIKVLSYKHLKWHPFDQDDEDVRDKVYDGFISYSNKDYQWVCHVLCNHLERSDKKYKLCLHDRDFRVGETIADNIRDAVRKSRRMIVVLSRNFLQSNWCMMEFREAHLKVMKEMSKFLILIVYDDIHEHDLDDELKFYMGSNTYLSINNKWFWDKMDYAMPVKSILNLKPELSPPAQLSCWNDPHPLGVILDYANPSHKEESDPYNVLSKDVI